MSEAGSVQLPIGYWLRKADQALTARIDLVQQATGLTRLEWQVLNVLQELNVATFDRIAEPLRPFADPPSLVEVIERLVQRELIESEMPGAPAYRLTREGRRVHGAALDRQQGVRRQAMADVSPEDYATTVRVLQQLVRNLSG